MVIRKWHEVFARGVLPLLLSAAACAADPSAPDTVRDPTSCGGQGDGKGTYCSLTASGAANVSMTAAQAIAAPRDADGNLPKLN